MYFVPHMDIEPKNCRYNRARMRMDKGIMSVNRLCITDALDNVEYIISVNCLHLISSHFLEMLHSY